MVRLFREMIEFIAMCFGAYIMGWLIGIGFIAGTCMTIMFFINQVIS